MMTKLVRRTSAILPFIMSGVVILAIIWHLLRFGLAHQTDEGTAAQFFQILMPLQLLVIGYFAVRWLPVEARWAAKVLAAQAAMFIAIVAVVFFFLDR